MFGRVEFMNNDRVVRIAELAGIDPDVADSIVNYDWPNAEEHKAFVEKATDREIANWVLAVAR